MMIKHVKGIYIHIPFCHKICTYCDFTKNYYNEAIADQYLNALEEEFYSYNIDGRYIESIYIGGGSPSSLNNIQLIKLMKIINSIKYPNLKEFSIELNPSDISLEQLTILKENQVNRISLGIQSLNDKILQEINRSHSKSDVIKTLALINEVGISNISIDVMYGFNTQTKDDIDDVISLITTYNITHIALYSLILEPNTILAYHNYEKDEDLDYELELYLKEKLSILNYENYEVSNYALNKKYSIHNLLYWSNEYYYGIGLGASGYLDNYRYNNTKSINNYLEGKYLYTKDIYETKQQELTDDIIMSFRLFNGIDLNRFNESYNIDFETYFNLPLEKYRNDISIIDNKLFLSIHAQNFLNDVINDFIDIIV